MKQETFNKVVGGWVISKLFSSKILIKLYLRGLNYLYIQELNTKQICIANKIEKKKLVSRILIRIALH
jgi:hypothetical protein